jgi:hypothetical protein
MPPSLPRSARDRNKRTSSVGGFLNLKGTGVTKLPDDLKVGGLIYGFNGNPPFKLKARMPSPLVYP